MPLADDNATLKNIPRPGSSEHLENSSPLEPREKNKLSTKKSHEQNQAKTYTRQEYFQALGSGLGNLLTRSLRAVENLKRDWQEWKDKK